MLLSNLLVRLPASAAALLQFNFHTVAESPLESCDSLQYLVITLKMKPGCFLWLQIPACSGFCPCLSLCFVLSANNPAKPQGFQFFETTDMFPVLASSSSSSGLQWYMDSAFLHWTLTSYRPEQRCGLSKLPCALFPLQRATPPHSIFFH